MDDKKYLSESILKFVLKKLEDLKQQSGLDQALNVDVIRLLVEQAQQQA